MILKIVGLKFVYLPDTIYDRGYSATNRKEASAVIQAAFEHYKKYGNDKSLGIGTFNIRQQQAILEELELQLKLNPQMEKFFTSNQDEHFFVKNLETIQGDERDVILVSIGYGFDANHRLSLNFGPLNHDGGERRLNVLITRAREQCIIFANFKARDIEIRPNAPFGLKALKVFLEYADTKNLESIDGPKEDTESPFEDSVYKFLTSNNYKVHKQVGCADFRIDLAVVDPKHPGKYLIGIECDGAMYHSSPVARDRDRLRQQVLEGLGWTFHRIWSTDWYRNRIESQNNLINAIEEVKINTMVKKPIINSDINKKRKEKEIIKREIESIEKIKPKSLEEKIIPYKTCDSLRIWVTGELHEKPVRELSRAVVQIVTIEGPIHKEEVIKRIRSFWGLKRAGKRIKDVLNNAMQLAERYDEISIKNDFLYLKDSGNSS